MPVGMDPIFSTKASDYTLLARQAGKKDGIKTWHARSSKRAMDVSIKVVDLEQNETVFASMQVRRGQKLH